MTCGTHTRRLRGQLDHASSHSRDALKACRLLLRRVAVAVVRGLLARQRRNRREAHRGLRLALAPPASLPYSLALPPGGPPCPACGSAAQSPGTSLALGGWALRPEPLWEQACTCESQVRRYPTQPPAGDFWAACPGAPRAKSQGLCLHFSETYWYHSFWPWCCVHARCRRRCDRRFCAACWRLARLSTEVLALVLLRVAHAFQQAGACSHEPSTPAPAPVH